MALETSPRRVRYAALLCSLAVVVFSGYQVVWGRSRQEPRDTPPARPAAGTSRISGQVIAADTGAPVKRATVSIVGRSFFTAEGARSNAAGRGVTAGLTVGRGFGSGAFPPQLTDEGGRFELPDLPGGTYQIMVSPRSGFVRTPRPQPVEVGDGQTASIVIRLERTGAITGRVLDESGEPLAHARVQALRRERMVGRRLMPTGSGSSTDDLGQFRLFDLPPGEYFVSASDQNYGPSNVPGPIEGYAPTYFPGTASLDGARPVTVRSARDTPGVEFSLARVSMGRITGTVRNSSGQVATSRVSVSLSRRGEDAFAFSRGSAVRPDGSFTITQIPPGEYDLAASVFAGDGPNAPREGAYLPIVVNGNEAVVDIQTNKGATVRGRVVVEGTPPPPPAGMTAEMPPEASRITVSTRPATLAPGVGMALATSGSVSPAEDGTFELTGLRGPLILTASGMRMALKSITSGAQDVTVRPLEFKGTEQVSNVTIVLTYDVGGVDGTVSDDRSEPVSGAMVIVFPEDSSRWFTGSPFIRYSRTMPVPPVALARAPQTLPVRGAPSPEARVPVPGRFMTTGLLPGRYHVVALDPQHVETAVDEQSLERLRQHALAVTVVVGSTATVQLTALKSF